MYHYPSLTHVKISVKRTLWEGAEWKTRNFFKPNITLKSAELVGSGFVSTGTMMRFRPEVMTTCTGRTDLVIIRNLISVS